MYRKIVLASDGSQESLVALREGALIASAYQAETFLLIVERETPSTRVADGFYPHPNDAGMHEILAYGLARLKQLGMRATGQVVSGDPALEIAACAKRFRADLVVVGHRRQSLLERWWLGASGAYLSDKVSCSVLIARNVISDAEFEAHLPQSTEAQSIA